MNRLGYVPMDKRSKRERRKAYAALRADWNGVVPVTKVIPNKKRPSRQAEKAMLYMERF